MRKQLLLLVIALFMSALSIAGIIDVGTPTHQGTEIDATPWEWDGHSMSEKQAQKMGADLACKYGANASHAVSFNIKKGGQKGTWRFSSDGSYRWCDFCQWFITDLKCYQERN